MSSSLNLFTQPDILHQIGIASLQKLLNQFTESDLGCLNSDSPYLCSELARVFAQPQSLSSRLCETLVLLETAASAENYERLAAIAQQRLPGFCVSEFHPLALALELWLNCPDDLSQFAPPLSQGDYVISAQRLRRSAVFRRYPGLTAPNKLLPRRASLDFVDLRAATSRRRIEERSPLPISQELLIRLRIKPRQILFTRRLNRIFARQHITRSQPTRQPKIIIWMSSINRHLRFLSLLLLTLLLHQAWHAFSLQTLNARALIVND
jgi:hypothetical protein